MLELQNKVFLHRESRNEILLGLLHKLIFILEPTNETFTCKILEDFYSYNIYSLIYSVIRETQWQCLKSNAF